MSPRRDDIQRETTPDNLPRTEADRDGKLTVAQARAAVEARRHEDRARQAARLEAAFGGSVPGQPTLVLSWTGTAILTIVTVLAAVDPDTFIAAFFVVAVTWFFAGSALFVVDLLLAAARSRDDAMGIGGLYFLAGSAPRSVQVHLNGSLLVSVIVTVTAAGIRPFTPLAFGVLAPVLALSLSGLWSVRHGLFEPRVSTR